MVTVWISAWEFECCGDPVVVGIRVGWPVQVANGSDWLERLAANTGVVVDYRYAVHEPDEGLAVVPLDAAVVKIEAVTAHMIAKPIDAWGTSTTIADGTATRRVVSKLDKRRPIEDCEDVHFVGYLVTVAH